jgi:hypothetical protein
MKTTIDIAREVDPVTKLLLDKKLPQGMDHDVFMWFLERFAELVRADEREVFAKIQFESILKAIKIEREACAVIAETPISGEQDDITMQAKDRVAAAIRNRGNT